MPVNDEDIEDMVAERLVDELERIDPGFAPVEAVLSHGRALRTRRRTLSGSSLAVLAVIAVSMSVTLALRPGTPTRGVAVPAPVRHSVALDAPYQDSKGQAVFSGTVDGKGWTAVVGTDGCVLASGSCLAKLPAPVDPAAFGVDNNSPDTDEFIAYVRPDIARFDVELTDGERLTAVPVTAGTHRLVVFKLPHGFGISQIIAYGADGKSAGYTIPFNRPDHMSSIVFWYRPDQQPTQPEMSGEISAGTLYGDAVSVAVRMGPFGLCFVRDTGEDLGCTTPDVPPPTSLLFESMASSFPTWVYGQVNPAVDHIDLALSNATVARLTPLALDGHLFVAHVVPAGVSVLSTTSYDSAGSQLAKS